MSYINGKETDEPYLKDYIQNLKKINCNQPILQGFEEMESSSTNGTDSRSFHRWIKMKCDLSRKSFDDEYLLLVTGSGANQDSLCLVVTKIT